MKGGVIYRLILSYWLGLGFGKENLVFLEPKLKENVVNFGSVSLEMHGGFILDKEQVVVPHLIRNTWDIPIEEMTK